MRWHRYGCAKLWQARNSFDQFLYFLISTTRGKIPRTVAVCLPCADGAAQVEQCCTDPQWMGSSLNSSTLQPWCFAICHMCGENMGARAYRRNSKCCNARGQTSQVLRINVIAFSWRSLRKGEWERKSWPNLILLQQTTTLTHVVPWNTHSLCFTAGMCQH